MKKLTIILAAILFMAAPTLNGQIFSVNLKGGSKLYMNITDTTLKTVEIVRPGLLLDSKTAAISGAIEIPSSVKYKDVLYKVTSIGERAFANSSELTFITIPSTIVRIDDEAFENCTKLEGVVFPAAEPTFGDNVFKADSLIKAVSIGSDWQSVDLGMFSSSKDLESVFIPAKVKKISNLKQAKSLKEVVVDQNNPLFSSKEGLLYSKDCITLYACPCGKSGKVIVADGTQKILNGAFEYCTMTTGIYLSASVCEFAYCEFMPCINLTELYIYSVMPPVTAVWNGTQVFSLRFANNNVKVYVPGPSISLYKTAINAKSGVYSHQGYPDTPLNADELVGKKSFAKIK